MVMARDWFAVAPLASVTRTVKLLVPPVVGVPLITPVAVFNVSPAGRLPTVTAHVYGVLPPVAASVWLYARFTVPSASAVVVTDSTAYTVMDSACVTNAPFASVTDTVKLLVPARVGVPLITPVLLLSPSPAGRLPTVTAHVTGDFPPVDAKVWLYANATVPSLSVVVVIANPV
jgi:hypothetical protein